jgi:hypothetical protein
MSKYIWLNKKQEMPIAIMLDKIDSLQIQYSGVTTNKYVLNIYMANKTYAEAYPTQREAKNRMDEILSMIEGVK